MYAKNTEYYLADESTYPLLHDLLTATGAEDVPFGFPTVYAVRKGVLLGFLGTHVDTEIVVAGPLVLDPTFKTPVIVAMRLIEVYEEILKRAGSTHYVFGVALDNLSWRATLAKLDFIPYDADSENEWFIRKID